MVPAMVGEIGRDELWEKVERGDEFVLVDALAPIAFARTRLPRAVNITPDWVDSRARTRIPDHSTEVVVYCADEGCDSSVVVARRLVELGYENVRHYPGGKRDWLEAGLPLEGSGVSRDP
jgi:rhodanese-related sulfurtransferase